ncbi:hypothetical protein BC941DRAFT_475739 [Chlamydoabsidia padenii]|nr:hypothetical protein BC941DRAFT_475739 [Chlamydoabsidia padenii]
MQLLISLCALGVLSLVESTCQQSITHDNKHMFVLASLNGKADRGAEALYKQAAEACYQDCNAAELMSLSSNYWKHRSPVTLLDRAATFLMESDFLQHNETYFVNHIAGAEEGPSGLEFLRNFRYILWMLQFVMVVCGLSGIVSTSENKTIVHHTVGTNINNDTANAVNPDHDSNKTSINISSGYADALDRANSNDGKHGSNNTITPQQVILNPSTKTNETIIDTEAQEEIKKNDKAIKEIALPTEDDLVFPLTIGDLNYKVIRLQKNHQTTGSAYKMCQSHRDDIGSLYSLSISHFSNWFQRVHPVDKSIIGTWNGDSYGAKDSQCLIYSVSQGVHLGSCADASLLLCQSQAIEKKSQQHPPTLKIPELQPLVQTSPPRTKQHYVEASNNINDIPENVLGECSLPPLKYHIAMDR